MKQIIDFNSCFKTDFFLKINSKKKKRNIFSKFNDLDFRKDKKLLIDRRSHKERIVYKYLLVKSNLEEQPFFNEIKIPLKYEKLRFKEPNYCKLFFKNSGSNIFVTLTTNKGEVLFSYSAGLFKKLRNRKEKTTLIVSKQIGQVISLRFYKSNLRGLFFYPEISSLKTRSRLNSMLYGLNFLRTNLIRYIFLKLRITRNGMRLKKSRR